MIIRVLLGAVLVLALVVSGVPAHADEEIGLSRDGQIWSDGLAEPLFDEDFRWVPGDTMIASFFVRNQGPSTAEMTIAVLTSDPDSLLANKDVVLDARVPGKPWIPLANGQPSTELSAATIARGRATRVDLRVSFLTTSPNQSQDDQLPLSLRVTLSESGDVGGVDEGNDLPGGDGVGGVDADSGSDSAGLPGTGAGVDLWVVWLGAALVGSGLAILAGRRRREPRDG